MKICRLAFLIVVQFSAAAVAAQAAHPIPEGIRRGESAGYQQQKIEFLNPRPTVDVGKLKHDADELAALAQSVPPAVDQTTKGVLPKDLALKLKRIEKLAKQLRSQLGP